MARRVGDRRGGSDRSGRAEVRWFVPGEAPRRLRPAARPARRQDAYELDSLRSHHAVKRRGASPFLERKERIGRVELVRPHGLAGFAERWSKERFRDRRLLLDGRWVVVSKAVWRTDGLEVARVAVDAAGEVAWTLCLDLSRPPSGPATELLDAWHPILDDRGEPSSYPAWLAALAGVRTTVEA
jgi:hypothetical protein